jgi:hypothetical protein
MPWFGFLFWGSVGQKRLWLHGESYRQEQIRKSLERHRLSMRLTKTSCFPEELMTKAQKLVQSSVILVAAGLFLAGCNNSGGDNSVAPPSDTGTQTTPTTPPSDDGLGTPSTPTTPPSDDGLGTPSAPTTPPPSDGTTIQ